MPFWASAIPLFFSPPFTPEQDLSGLSQALKRFQTGFEKPQTGSILKGCFIFSFYRKSLFLVVWVYVVSVLSQNLNKTHNFIKEWCYDNIALLAIG